MIVNITENGERKNLDGQIIITVKTAELRTEQKNALSIFRRIQVKNAVELLLTAQGTQYLPCRR